jgi:hypothetical protein
MKRPHGVNERQQVLKLVVINHFGKTMYTDVKVLS